jgi:hypothetical protein
MPLITNCGPRRELRAIRRSFENSRCPTTKNGAVAGGWQATSRHALRFYEKKNHFGHILLGFSHDTTLMAVTVSSKKE